MPPGLGMLWSSLRAQHGNTGWVIVGGSGIVWAHGADCRAAWAQTRRVFEKRMIMESKYAFNLAHARPLYVPADIPEDLRGPGSLDVIPATFVKYASCLGCGKWLNSPSQVCDHLV